MEATIGLGKFPGLRTGAKALVSSGFRPFEPIDSGPRGSVSCATNRQLIPFRGICGKIKARRDGSGS